MVPEKRVDRLGRSITRWVRPDNKMEPGRSILGTVLPTISPSVDEYISETSQSYAAEHAELSERISLVIQKEIGFDPEDEKLFGRTRPHEERKRDAEKLKAKLERQADEAVAKLQDFEVVTLRILLDRLDGTQMMMFVIRHPKEELELREGLHYAPMEKGFSPAPPSPTYLEAIRKALDVDDLTAYPRESREYHVVMTVIDLLGKDRERRFRADEKKERLSPRTRYWAEDRGVSRTPVITIGESELSSLIDTVRQYPDSKEEIDEFLIDRDLELGKVDYGYLRVHLDNAAPALGDGLL